MMICFAIGVLAFTGVILREDVAGRMTFGFVWTALGFVWLGQYLGAFSRHSVWPPDGRDAG